MAEEIKTEGTENEGPNCTWTIEKLVEHYEQSFFEQPYLSDIHKESVSSKTEANLSEELADFKNGFLTWSPQSLDSLFSDLLKYSSSAIKTILHPSSRKSQLCEQEFMQLKTTRLFLV